MKPEFAEFIFSLTGGNPGAMRVVFEVIKDNEGEPECAGLILSMLERLKLSGAEIWMLYKDECGEDINAFCRAVIERCASELLVTRQVRT
jgi:hypothetical protein